MTRLRWTGADRHRCHRPVAANKLVRTISPAKGLAEIRGSQNVGSKLRLRIADLGACCGERPLPQGNRVWDFAAPERERSENEGAPLVVLSCKFAGFSQERGSEVPNAIPPSASANIYGKINAESLTNYSQHDTRNTLKSLAGRAGQIITSCATRNRPL